MQPRKMEEEVVACQTSKDEPQRRNDKRNKGIKE
jgi:hypothetical protein